MSNIKPHSDKSIAIAASMLGNMISAGLPADEALSHLSDAQPNQGWNEVAIRIAKGSQLSECLVGLWPEALVSAIAAGEYSGKLADVLKQVDSMMLIKKQISEALQQFYAPMFYLLGGICTAIFYLVSVIPTVSTTSKALIGASYKPSAAMKVSFWFQDVFINHWYAVCIVLIGIIVGGAWLVRQQEFWAWLYEIADKIPKLNTSLRKLYFGLWAKTISMMAASGGIDIIEMLILSSKILPANMRDGVILMASEVERRGLSEAGDPRRQAEDDPRRQWPMYIGIAFVSAGQTGDIEVEMKRIAPELIDEGMRTLTIIIQAASHVAVAITGLLAAFAPALMILEQGSLFTQTMSM
jgi:type II secretory pathway component PulF